MHQLPQENFSTASTQTIVKSFDSSLIYSYPSHSSSNLQDQQRMLKLSLTTHLNTPDNHDNLTMQLQKTRHQQQNNSILNQNIGFHSCVGFVFGKQKKRIQFNDNQIKKAKNFFDDTPPSSQNDVQNENNTLGYFPIISNWTKNQQFDELSLPCFKIGGLNGAKIQIKEQNLQKAKQFFKDQAEKSNKKPTKVKKNEQRNEQYEKDFIKTANFKTKTLDFKQKSKQKPKKQTFDWCQYQKDIHKTYQGQISNLSFSPQKYFKSIKVKDLSIQTVKQDNRIKEFEQRSQNWQISYLHCKQKCDTLECLLCKLNQKDTQINIQRLYQIFTKRLTIYQISFQDFLQIYKEVYNKLLKFQIFHPQVSNKKVNPSTILYQIFKKQQKINRQKYNGWISYILQQQNHFNTFIAYIKKTYFAEKMNLYFIHLSDGWSSVWVAIQKYNSLYKYISKMKVCSKIFVAYWNFHPLANILNYCPFSNSNQKCIQIYYNSTIMVNQNTKLGKVKFLFYRPLNKCKKEGGIIPTVEGTIVRMFYLKQTKKQLKAVSMRQNYLQILTPQGFTILVRFLLSEENTLAQMFRLYYCYQFYHLKIGNEGQLCFGLPHSKFFQLPFEKKHIYSQNLVCLLKKRYLNQINLNQIQKIKVGQCYDIKIEENKLTYSKENYTFTIDDQSQGKNVILYQQLVVSYKNEKTKQIVLKKHKYTNTLRCLPKIYKTLGQNQ